MEGQHLTGVVVLSPDDLCYPLFLLFFIIVLHSNNNYKNNIVINKLLTVGKLSS